MPKCSHAGFASPCRRRSPRTAAPPCVPPSSAPPVGTRPRHPGRWSAVLATVAAGTTLWACADTVWEPSGPGDPSAPAFATVMSKSASTDAPSLPPWLESIRSMESEGCVIHLRRADGGYASKTYRLRYGRGARTADGRWRALVYTVRGVVTRPVEGGGTETLPERLGARAACLLPDTRRGMDEARGRVEAILAEAGLPGFRRASADAGTRGSGWAAAWAALGRLAERLPPRPLAAAQQQCYTYPPSMFGVGCPEMPGFPPVNNVTTPINVTCPAGFDFEYSSGNCVKTGFSPVPPITPGNGNTGGGGGTPPPPLPPPPLTCTDDQIAIADEYDDPVAWPCTQFTHSVISGGDHGHTTGYLSGAYLSGSAAVLSEVSGASINSDWRCPTGNAAIPNSASNSQHVQGTAGDFDAPNFDHDLWIDFRDAADAAGASAWSYYPGTPECAASPSGWCYSTYIHIDWR